MTSYLAKYLYVDASMKSIAYFQNPYTIFIQNTDLASKESTNSVSESLNENT